MEPHTAPAGAGQQENSEKLDSQELKELVKIVWGDKIKEEVFQRWLQGFKFSEEEPLALVQYQGGPCALIVPIQAFIIKAVLMVTRNTEFNFGNRLATGRNEDLLFEAITEILMQCSSDEMYVIERDEMCLMSTNVDQKQGISCEKQANSCRCLGSAAKIRKNNDNVEGIGLDALPTDVETFHKNFRKRRFHESDKVKLYLEQNKSIYFTSDGLLLILYSVVLTKGISRVRNDMGIDTDTLLDPEHGIGNQSLINLLTCGRAVPHVWDMDRYVDGLCLGGITEQSRIGFLTILEDLKYCRVGSLLKSPKYPIWIIGSETHLSLLFSQNESLAHCETLQEKATRTFQSYDKQDNGFIQSSFLGEVLEKLDLFCDPDYVNMLLGQLDSESLGIILLKPFLEMFFPDKEPDSSATNVVIYHYNGLIKNNSLICFNEGQIVNAVLEQELSQASPFVKCIRTKWPNADVVWKKGVEVSLN